MRRSVDPDKWWQASADSPLQVIHVGGSYSPTTGDYGLTILFSSAPAINQDWREMIHIMDASGEQIIRDWLPSRNPRGIYLPSLPAGKYRLTLEPRIRDTQGRMLEIFLQGWITIP